MAYEMLHFRGSQEAIQNLNMEQPLMETLDYVDLVVQDSSWKGTMLTEVLEETGWRNSEDLVIIPNRRYKYKGYMGALAIEGNLTIHEYMLEGLFRMQIGYDKESVQAGVLLLGNRKWTTPFQDNKQLLDFEIRELYPTISLPVSVALFDCQ